MPNASDATFPVVTREITDICCGRGVVKPFTATPFTNVWPPVTDVDADVLQIVPGAPVPPAKLVVPDVTSPSRYGVEDAVALSFTTQNTVRIVVSRVVNFRKSEVPSKRRTGRPLRPLSTLTGLCVAVV